MLRNRWRWREVVGCAAVLLVVTGQPAEAPVLPKPPKDVAVVNARKDTAPPPPPTSTPAAALMEPPAGAHRPRTQPPDLRYVDSVGLCFASGPVVLPGVENPIAWSMPGCPAGPAGAAGPAAARRPSPSQAAVAAWWQTTLPDPTLATSPPDGAITGLDLYLSIGGSQKLTFDVQSLGYAVQLEVGSTYDVDWGDPRPDGSVLGRTVTRGHRTQGGTWPNGDLRHQYVERGSATIEVTQRWTARWTAGGESGTISDVLYTQASTTIPVQEIVAVLKP